LTKIGKKIYQTGDKRGQMGGSFLFWVQILIGASVNRASSALGLGCSNHGRFADGGGAKE
jgi:hypothetical protein